MGAPSPPRGPARRSGGGWIRPSLRSAPAPAALGQPPFLQTVLACCRSADDASRATGSRLIAIVEAPAGRLGWGSTASGWCQRWKGRRRVSVEHHRVQNRPRLVPGPDSSDNDESKARQLLARTVTEGRRGEVAPLAATAGACRQRCPRDSAVHHPRRPGRPLVGRRCRGRKHGTQTGQKPSRSNPSADPGLAGIHPLARQGCAGKFNTVRATRARHGPHFPFPQLNAAWHAAGIGSYRAFNTGTGADPVTGIR